MLDLHPLGRDGLVLRVNVVVVDRVVLQAGSGQLLLQHFDHCFLGQVLPAPAALVLGERGRLGVHLLEVVLALAEHVGPEAAQAAGEVSLALAGSRPHGQTDVLVQGNLLFRQSAGAAGPDVGPSSLEPSRHYSRWQFLLAAPTIEQVPFLSMAGGSTVNARTCSGLFGLLLLLGLL